jgi:hypothetical protein
VRRAAIVAELGAADLRAEGGRCARRRLAAAG